MKKQCMILLMALILCFMVGCQDKEAMAELEAMKAQAALEEQNKALFTRYQEELLEGDIEALKEIFSPDYVLHQPGQDRSLEEGIEALKQQRAMLTDWTISVEAIIAKRDKVILRYIGRATHGGDVEGFPATGNKIEVEGIEIVRIENGKIVEGWEILDRLGLMMQLGMELKPKEEER